MPSSLVAEVTCAGPLTGTDFSSIAELPVAELCAKSATVGGPGARTGNVQRAAASCGGSILVTSLDKVDCKSFWLFDERTGSLQAMGGACNAHWACNGATPAFRFPSECIDPWGWGSLEELCASDGAGVNGSTDGGADGGLSGDGAPAAPDGAVSPLVEGDGGQSED